MKVALVQMNVIPGQTALNVARIKAEIRKYDSKGYDFIVFPELCVGGYMVGDLWCDPDWIAEQSKANQDLLAFIALGKFELGVIFGSIRRGAPGMKNEDGRPALYNTAWFVQNRDGGGQDIAYSDKALLPNYRFFDDKRYFSAGEKKIAVSARLRNGGSVLIGLEVCEDLWHEDYARNPTAELCDSGAQYIFNISASPYSYSKRKARDRVIERTLKLASTTTLELFFYVNCVGAQNNGKNILTFDGDCCVYDNAGIQQLGSDNLFVDEILEYDSDAPPRQWNPKKLDKAECQYQACLTGIRSLDTLMGAGFPYVIGVSGGIDSALVLCLLERAVGASRVRAFNMPSVYNSDATKNNARSMCELLGISLQSIPIQALVDAQLKLFREAGMQPSEFNIENIQAKTRGTSILSTITGIIGGVMTNNGNKLEVALGYTTLYGDVNGAIAPLGDLLKTEVWEMARYVNASVYGKEIIPGNLIPDPTTWEMALPPSAELKHAQVDPMKWGYHDALLAYMTNFMRGSLVELMADYKTSLEAFARRLSASTDSTVSAESILLVLKKNKLDDMEEFRKDLFWFVDTVGKAVFKRIQSPPIIVQSESAYGFDIRESQLRRIRSDIAEALS